MSRWAGNAFLIGVFVAILAGYCELAAWNHDKIARQIDACIAQGGTPIVTVQYWRTFHACAGLAVQP